jgi:CDP-glycerol glycerophosphotransferase
MLLRAERISALPRACYQYRQARPGSFMATPSSAQLAIFGSYERVFALAASAEPPLASEVRAALFERAIWHYTTLLPLVPRSVRHGYFRRMHGDFVRYRPVGYRHPPGVRGVRFWLVERNACMIYTVLAAIKRAAGSRSLRR